MQKINHWSHKNGLPHAAGRWISLFQVSLIDSQNCWTDWEVFQGDAFVVTFLLVNVSFWFVFQRPILWGEHSLRHPLWLDFGGKSGFSLAAEVWCHRLLGWGFEKWGLRVGKLGNLEGPSKTSTFWLEDYFRLDLPFLLVTVCWIQQYWKVLWSLKSTEKSRSCKMFKN